MFAHDLKWSHCPRTIQLVLQLTFVSEAIKAVWGGLLRGGNYGKHGGPVPVIRVALRSAEDALAVLPQDRESAIPVSANSRKWVQLGDSAARPMAAFGREQRKPSSTPRPGRVRSKKKRPSQPLP